MVTPNPNKSSTNDLDESQKTHFLHENKNLEFPFQGLKY